MATLKRKKTTAKKSNLVNIKNDLVESFIKSNNLTALKILFFLAYDCISRPEHLVKISLNTKQLCDYCKINEQTLKRNIKQMQETSISWKDEEGENFVSVIPKARFGFNGVLEIEMFDDILNMIIDVKNKYTTINAEQLMLMTSKHSARMLLLLEMINGFDVHIPKLKKYEFEELNLLFGTKYKRLVEFEREVLKKAKEDLDNNSKISFIYDIMYDKEFNTVGRAKAVGVTIHLIDNNPQPKLF